MLDLRKLEAKLDKALANETKETLASRIKNKRALVKSQITA